MERKAFKFLLNDKLSNLKSSGLPVEDESVVTMSYEESLLYQSRILPLLELVRQDEMDRYRSLLEPLLSLINVSEQCLQQQLLRSLQPSASIVAIFNQCPKDAVEIYTRVLDDAGKHNFNSPEDVISWIKQDVNRQLTVLAETTIVTLLLCDVKEFISLCNGKITYSDDGEEMNMTFVGVSPTRVHPLTANTQQGQYASHHDSFGLFDNQPVDSVDDGNPNIQNIYPMDASNSDIEHSNEMSHLQQQQQQQ